MAQIIFHFNVDDPVAYGYRLLRKALRQGVKVLVTGPTDDLERLDQALWTRSALEFLPHCRAGAPVVVLTESPIVLAGAASLAAAQSQAEAKLLLNFGGEVGLNPDLFERWAEIVGVGPHNRTAARVRWKAYTAAGHAVLGHDATTAAEGAR